MAESMESVELPGDTVGARHAREQANFIKIHSSYYIKQMHILQKLLPTVQQPSSHTNSSLTEPKIAHCQQSMQGHFVAQWLTFATVKVNSICRFFNAHIFSEVD
ncbi:hypothetical protein STEG23_036244 [Scotinomys teguina]